MLLSELRSSAVTQKNHKRLSQSADRTHSGALSIDCGLIYMTSLSMMTQISKMIRNVSFSSANVRNKNTCLNAFKSVSWGL